MGKVLFTSIIMLIAVAAQAQLKKVYPHIILGGNGCSAYISTPTALWAEQDIVLDKGFELAPCTAFSARVIAVPDPDHSPLYIQNCHNH